MPRNALVSMAEFRNYFDTDTWMSAGGVAGGILAGEYLGQTLSAKLGWTGLQRLAVLGVGKTVLGYIFYKGATSTSGNISNLLKAASIGAPASFIADLIAYFWGGMGSKTTRSVSTPKTSKSVSTVPTSSGGETISIDEL